MKWGSAQQGISGLWFKPGLDNQGRRHLLVSDTRKGVDSGSHDHYWEKTKDGKDGYGVQLRDRSGTSSVAGRKGHLYAVNTSFPSATNKYLKELFKTYCK